MKWFLHAKIHKAIVTEANLNYIGSITIDKTLMEKTGLLEGEKVLVVDNTNGQRLETYVISGEKNSGTICMNGAAAHLIKKGDEIIIMGFQLSKKTITPKCILVNKKNKFIKFLKMDSSQNYEIQIKKAKLENIKDILSIQKENIIPIQELKKSGTSQKGFLIHSLSEIELKKIINDSKNHILIIGEKNNQINGYILAYELNKWKKLKPNWIKEINTSKEIKEKISKNKFLYLRHIARRINKKGYGNKLLTEMIKIAKLKKYKYIICEILDKPIENTLSKKFHEQFGFKKIGTIKEENLIWGLYIKKI